MIRLTFRIRLAAFASGSRGTDSAWNGSVGNDPRFTRPASNSRTCRIPGTRNSRVWQGAGERCSQRKCGGADARRAWPPACPFGPQRRGASAGKHAARRAARAMPDFACSYTGTGRACSVRIGPEERRGEKVEAPTDGMAPACGHGEALLRGFTVRAVSTPTCKQGLRVMSISMATGRRASHRRRSSGAGGNHGAGRYWGLYAKVETKRGTGCLLAGDRRSITLRLTMDRWILRI